MKIGILTLPFNNNYGGFLQAYALMEVLKQLGHEPVLIQRRPNEPRLRTKVRYAVKALIRSVAHCKKHAIIYRPELEYENRGKKMHLFVKRYISPMTMPINSSKELSEKCEGRFDAVIVGSDQVWRPAFVPEIVDYFLHFVKNDRVKRIAYAASFGTEMPMYTHRQILKCGRLVELFDAISVREMSGVSLFKQFKWRSTPPQVVLDPTLLLSKECYYLTLIASPPDKKAIHTVFCYVLDSSPAIEGIVDRTCSLLNKKAYYLLDKKRWKKPDYVMPSIEAWLCAFRDTDFVITDSFHGTVFSILYNKPFVVCINENRGADRFSTLLGHFNLENRIVTSKDDVKEVLKEKIDWEQVNERMSYLKATSISFLKNAIGV